MEEVKDEKGIVCVTGVTGFIASWVVKHLFIAAASPFCSSQPGQTGGSSFMVTLFFSTSPQSSFWANEKVQQKAIKMANRNLFFMIVLLVVYIWKLVI